MVASGKILVTGATGFIGSHLVDALVEKKRDVRCLVEKNSDIRHLQQKGVEIVCGDLTDKDSLQSAIKSVEVVYHLAAVLSYSREPEEKYMQVNYNGTKNLLETAANRNLKKFVYFSSIGVAGSRSEPILLNENSPCEPVSPYERSKAKAERIVLEYFTKYKLPVVIIRPSKVYGERDLSESLTLYRLVQKGLFRFVGNMRKNKWSFCYVRDLIEASMTAEEKSSCIGETYFISGERPYSLEEFVRAIAIAENVKMPKVDVPVWLGKLGMFCFQKFKRMQGERQATSGKAFAKMIQRHQMCDISKAREELKYAPQFSLEEGMRHTIHWYQKNGFLS